MTVLSPLQILDGLFYLHPGQPDAFYAIATQVSLAESGGRSDAISPSGDYGYWQINRRWHFGDGIINDNNWQNFNVQVAEMWKLSGGGHNWAAWCTAWAPYDVGRCGQGYLPAPQPGSPADDQQNVVSPLLDRIRGNPAPGQTPNAIPPNQQLTPGESADFAYIKGYLAQGYATQLLAIQDVNNALGRVF